MFVIGGGEEIVIYKDEGAIENKLGGHTLRIYARIFPKGFEIFVFTVFNGLCANRTFKVKQISLKKKGIKSIWLFNFLRKNFYPMYVSAFPARGQFIPFPINIERLVVIC